MLIKNTLENFNSTWQLFDYKMLDVGGSMFLIEPLIQYFELDFVNKLTEENSKTLFHEQMLIWGEIEQCEHEKNIIDQFELPDGTIHNHIQFKEPEVRWARKFIISAFYNLCCLASRKITLEELIFIANQTPTEDNREEVDKAFFELIGISNSFLSADWSKGIVQRAVSNRDKEFFKQLSRWLQKDIPKEKFDTARAWLGTTMLWYLGGKDIPRREFMLVLRKYDIISPQKEELSFNAELRKLNLIK